MFTPAFEEFWAKQGVFRTFTLGQADPAEAKRMCWEAWRVGREKLAEEMSAERLLLQPVCRNYALGGR